MPPAFLESRQGRLNRLEGLGGHSAFRNRLEDPLPDAGVAGEFLGYAHGVAVELGGEEGAEGSASLHCERAVGEVANHAGDVVLLLDGPFAAAQRGGGVERLGDGSGCGGKWR